MKSGRLPSVPSFPTITVKNARKGFFEESDFERVLARLPKDVRPLVQFLWLTGWRKGEALCLQWRNVDFVSGTIRIEETKSGEPRDASLPRATGARRTHAQPPRADGGPPQEAWDHRALGLPPQERPSDPGHPPCLGDGLYRGGARPGAEGRRRKGRAPRGVPHPSRLPPDRRPANGAGWSATVRRHEDQRPQDRVDLPAVRDRGRAGYRGRSQEGRRFPEAGCPSGKQHGRPVLEAVRWDGKSGTNGGQSASLVGASALASC